MKNKTKLIIACSVLALALAVIGIFLHQKAVALREEAATLTVVGDYEQAKLIYEKLKDADAAAECDMFILERDYQRAKLMLQRGEYDDAKERFVALGDYKDSRNLIDACTYFKAGAIADSGDPISARELYLSIPDYPGVDAALDALNLRLYDLAMQHAYSFELDEAAHIWQLLGGYSNSRTMLWRAQRAKEWAAEKGSNRLITEDKHFRGIANAYESEAAYIVIPEECDSSTRFFVYYPGGNNQDVSIDYVLYYLMNPAPNTIAVFMRRNNIPDINPKLCEAMDVLEQAASECGVFAHDIVVCGSSLGAYLAMQSPLCSMEYYGISTRAVMTLDTGLDWTMESLALNERDCERTAELGDIDFYLFDSIGVGTNRPPIARMVDAGLRVTMVGCVYDDHERITLDAMGMGIIDWTLGDRAEPSPLNIYRFVPLYQ